MVSCVDDDDDVIVIETEGSDSDRAFDVTACPSPNSSLNLEWESGSKETPRDLTGAKSQLLSLICSLPLDVKRSSFLRGSHPIKTSSRNPSVEQSHRDLFQERL